MMVKFGITFLPGSWFSCRALSNCGERAQLAQSKKSLKSGLSMSKLNYSERSNQWCNRRVNMFLHLDFKELQRS